MHIKFGSWCYQAFFFFFYWKFYAEKWVVVSCLTLVSLQKMIMCHHLLHHHCFGGRDAEPRVWGVICCHWHSSSEKKIRVSSFSGPLDQLNWVQCWNCLFLPKQGSVVTMCLNTNSVSYHVVLCNPGVRGLGRKYREENAVESLRSSLMYRLPVTYKLWSYN